MGKGPEWLVCLHGYGESGDTFTLFEPLAGKDYTLIAIDLPFHGKTDWQEGLLFTVDQLIEIINLIIPDSKPFSLLGYSMGGRVALQLIQYLPRRIKKAVLIAPDGLHRNIWQWLSTQTLLGNQLFAFTMQHPGWIFQLMKLSAGLGLFNKSILKFVHHYLDDAAQRRILYRRWTTMRQFRPDKTFLQKQLIENRIKLVLLFGEYDRVIVSKHGYNFQKQAAENVAVKVIPAGHLLLKEKYVTLVMELLG